jgi:hypothetical protein
MNTLKVEEKEGGVSLFFNFLPLHVVDEHILNSMFKQATNTLKEDYNLDALTQENDIAVISIPSQIKKDVPNTYNLIFVFAKQQRRQFNFIGMIITTLFSDEITEKKAQSLIRTITNMSDPTLN